MKYTAVVHIYMKYTHIYAADRAADFFLDDGEIAHIETHFVHRRWRS